MVISGTASSFSPNDHEYRSGNARFREELRHTFSIQPFLISFEDVDPKIYRMRALRYMFSSYLEILRTLIEEDKVTIILSQATLLHAYVSTSFEGRSATSQTAGYHVPLSSRHSTPPVRLFPSTLAEPKEPRFSQTLCCYRDSAPNPPSLEEAET